jgi:hypothetical protein
MFRLPIVPISEDSSNQSFTLFEVYFLPLWNGDNVLGRDQKFWLVYDVEIVSVPSKWIWGKKEMAVLGKLHSHIEKLQIINLVEL